MFVDHAAQLPALVFGRHGLPAELERSFRLERGVGLLRNRHVLGCPARLISADCFEQMVAEMGMPVSADRFRSELLPQLQHASTVYLGYEQCGAGDTHRLYFEYWDAVVQRLRATPAADIGRWHTGRRPRWEMGRGHKWLCPAGHAVPISPQQPSVFYTSVYWVMPLLPQQELLKLAEATLRSAAVPEDLGLRILSLMRWILMQDPTIDPIFLEVVEAGSPRRSFDLCVHRLGLRLTDLESWLNPIVQWLLGDDSDLSDCVQVDQDQAWVTHVSAGCSRRGQPYCCVYYVLGTENV